MALLDDAIEASGGMARWTKVKRFTLQLSIDGALFSQMGQAGSFKDIVAEGSTELQSVRLAGLTGSGSSGLYQPDSVTIESLAGEVLQTWPNPRQAFFDSAAKTKWDQLYFVFFCGFSLWNYLTTPFLLAQPGVVVEELSPWSERDQLWRRLRATFPPDVVTHGPDQIFYFDAGGLQRRTDHDLLGLRVADYSWAHQTFSDIVVPTLRRSLRLGPDGTAIARPALVDVEIFDASFE
jgi:hypothetical protein